jgi:hypothetical protein
MVLVIAFLGFIGINAKAEIVSGWTATVTTISNRTITFQGTNEVHVTASSNPMPGTTIDMQSTDTWLFFDNIRPQTFATNYLSQITVNGAAAVANTNIRVVQYKQGTVVISQPSTYQPLTIYNAASLTGSSMSLNQYTYYNSTQLGTMNNATRSFRLKRGYMATFATNDNGLGYSKVYIADNADVVINTMPTELNANISFIRVFPWRWVAKKGWTGDKTLADTLRCTWNYDWDNVAVSNLNIEYVPMRHNLWWNAYDNINNKTNSTHALAFNEPDRPDQANMTVAQAVAEWPNLLKSGLRLGSPVPSDGAPSWVFKFIDTCDYLGYRVDFVAVHWYKGGQTARQYYDWLRWIYLRTGRPIWITEWNNGANWTCCEPTLASQATAIQSFLNMLDTVPWVERHCLYEWVGATRQMFSSTNPITLNPAGIVYRDKVSPIAYTAAGAVVRPTAVISGATFSVIARHSGKALTAAAGGTGNGTNVQQNTYTGANYQQWTITNETGYYRFTPSHATGQAMDVAGQSTSDGANIDTWSYWGGANQLWSITKNSSGYYVIKAKNSGKCLDVSGVSTADGANVVQWTCNGGNNQQWSLSRTKSAVAQENEVDLKLDISEITLYPNPFSGNVLTVNLIGLSGATTINVIDSKGRIVTSELVNDQPSVKMAVNLKSGLYLVQLVNSQSTYTKKLLVK